MLNGLDPIIIFNFKKIPPVLEGIAKIPIVASIVSAIDLPAIPIYLSEKLTGLFIESEGKNIDIDTTTDALSNGATPNQSQRVIGSVTRISMIARSDSLGVSLMSALTDFIIPKVTSKEYSITYLHGAVTIFAGLLHSFSIEQGSDDTLYRITLELIKPPVGGIISNIPVVGKVVGATPL